MINLVKVGKNAGLSGYDTRVCIASAVLAYDPPLIPALQQFVKDYGGGPSSALSVGYQQIR